MSEEREEFYAKQNAYISGYDEGVEHGIEQNKREMVIKFHEQQVPLEVIAKASELSLEEVQKIIAESKNREEN